MKKQKIKKQDVDAAVALQAPARRCHLCQDGGVGKLLVQVVDAVRQKKWACQTHAAFFGRERTGINRKYLPGNDTQSVVAAEKAAAESPIEIAPDAGQDEPRSTIKVRDRK
jgi:hypothetical protein